MTVFRIECVEASTGCPSQRRPILADDASAVEILDYASRDQPVLPGWENVPRADPEIELPVLRGLATGRNLGRRNRRKRQGRKSSYQHEPNAIHEPFSTGWRSDQFVKSDKP
jgi:hypothetical protein